MISHVKIKEKGKKIAKYKRYVKSFRFSDEHKITRRSSSITDFGCENHTTSLAAASLAVFIRENIENALSQS